MLKHDVAALATAQGRMVGTEGHDFARDHIVARLERIGVQPYSSNSFMLPYEYNGEAFVNIVGQIPGRNRDLPQVLLGAHYDTCGPYPGADDNAAAVAVLLAAAERLKEIQLDRTLVLAFFDAEEPPYYLSHSMGSIRFYEDQKMQDIHCAIIMDLVGHDVPFPGLEDLVFITGMESDPGLEQVVKEAEPFSGIRTIPTLNAYVGDMSDHHIFRTNSRPYLFLTCGRWEHYHSPSDTPDRLNYEKMTVIADYLAELAERVSLKRLEGPFEGFDTTDTEIYFLTKNIKPSLERFGLAMDIESREDINQLVDLMMTQFDL